MAFFNQDYLDFFKELAANNHKAWFDANRKRYETVVRDPFRNFIAQLITEMSKTDPELEIEAKDAIFRINRDIRFSKDKTPYKLNNSAIISKEGRKNKNHPGVYLELGPEKLAFYGGIYAPDNKQIEKIRSYFTSHANELNAVLNETGFKHTFGEIHGEKSKRLPREFKEAGEQQPLVWNKQWYYYCHLPPEVILQDNLLTVLLDLTDKASGIKKILTSALYTTA
jgi:uncharacterized protein (TIGR02453 family)